MIFMKPIHNGVFVCFARVFVVIPHKVNDFYETNSQLVLLLEVESYSCDSSQS